MHQEHSHNLYHQLMPAIIVMIGLIVGLYAYFYITNVESSVQRSLGSNNSPQSAVIGTAEAEEEETTMTKEDAALQKMLDDFTKKQFATTAVYVHDLERDIVASSNATTTFKAASMYKLFVAYETLLRVDEGDLSLDQAVGYDVGAKSIAACLDAMITVSDNPCGRALRKLLDVTERPLPRLAELGFMGTNLAYDYPTTSAQDVGLLFEKLYRQEDLSKKSNQLFLTHLKNQTVNYRIPQGLPKGTEVAHKTGDLEGFAHDGGIVYHHSGDYIFVILGGPWESDLSTVNANYARFTEQIHQYLSDDDR